MVQQANKSGVFTAIVSYDVITPTNDDVTAVIETSKPINISTGWSAANYN